MGVLGACVRITFEQWLDYDDVGDAERHAIVDGLIREGRWADLDKSWDALSMLLGLATDGRVSLTSGGFSAPRYGEAEVTMFDGGMVKELAETLADLPFDRLAAAYAPEPMSLAYPQGVWTAGSVPSLEGAYGRLRELVAAARADKDFLLIVIG